MIEGTALPSKPSDERAHPMTDKSVALRTWARGTAAVEAATELLLRFEDGR